MTGTCSPNICLVTLSWCLIMAIQRIRYRPTTTVITKKMRRRGDPTILFKLVDVNPIPNTICSLGRSNSKKNHRHPLTWNRLNLCIFLSRQYNRAGEIGWSAAFLQWMKEFRSDSTLKHLAHHHTVIGQRSAYHARIPIITPMSCLWLLCVGLETCLTY